MINYQDLQGILDIQLDMEADIRADIYGDIYGHHRWAEEVYNLRKRLALATQIITEARDLQITGGYLGQQESLIYHCKQFLGIGKDQRCHTLVKTGLSIDTFKSLSTLMSFKTLWILSKPSSCSS